MRRAMAENADAAAAAIANLALAGNAAALARVPDTADSAQSDAKVLVISSLSKGAL